MMPYSQQSNPEARSLRLTSIQSVLVIAGFTLLYWLGASAGPAFGLASIIVAGIGVAVFWLVKVGPRLIHNLILLIALLVLAPPIRLIEGYPVIFGDELLIFGLGGLLLLQSASQPNRPPASRVSWPLFFLLLFIPITMLSMAYGYWQFNVELGRGDWFEFLKLAKYILAFYIASRVRLYPGHLRFLSTAIASIISIAAVIGVLQRFGVGGVRDFFSLVYFSGFNQTGIGPELNRIASLQVNRAVGTVGNPNEFGLLLTIGLAFSLALFVAQSYRGIGRAALLLLTLVLMAAILLSGSRTAVLAALAAGGYIGMVYLFHQSSRQPRTFARAVVPGHFIGRLALVAIPILLSIAAISFGKDLPVAQAAIGNPLQRVKAGLDWESDASLQDRLRLLDLGLEQAGKSIILGYGSGEGAWEGQLVAPGATDNEVLGILLRFGVVGLAVFALFWISAFNLARSLGRVFSREVWVFGHATAAVILINLVGMLAVNSFYDLHRMTLTCILLGLCVAVHRWVRLEHVRQT